MQDHVAQCLVAFIMKPKWRLRGSLDGRTSRSLNCQQSKMALQGWGEVEKNILPFGFVQAVVFYY